MDEREIQKTKILRYMEQKGSITGAEAFRNGMGMRLAARIADLKKDGFPVLDEWEQEYDPNGKYLGHHKRYFLPEQFRATHERFVAITEEGRPEA